MGITVFSCVYAPMCWKQHVLTTVSAVNGAVTAMVENGVDLGQIVQKKHCSVFVQKLWLY